MKKIFILVALAGMLILMSFGNKKQKMTPWCETVEDVCGRAASDAMYDFGFDDDWANDFWDRCNAINGCN